MQKEIEIINDGLSYKEKLECIAKRFGMTQEQALKTIVEEVYNSESSSLGFSLKDALDLILVLSISLDTFYSNKNYATRKI